MSMKDVLMVGSAVLDLANSCMSVSNGPATNTGQEVVGFKGEKHVKIKDGKDRTETGFKVSA